MMINILERGMNFAISSASVTVEITSRDNGLKLMAVVTDSNQNSKISALQIPTNECVFETDKKCKISLPSCGAAFEKIEFYAFNDDAQSVDATLIITQDNGARHSIQTNFVNASACMFGRIYNHNGTWKAKNLADMVSGNIDTVLTMYKGNNLAEELLKMKSHGGLNSNGNSQISMASSQPVAQNQSGHFNMAPTPSPQNGQVERINPGSNLPATTRPSFGRNRSNSGFSSRIEQGQEAATQTLGNVLNQGRSLFSRFANFSKGKAQEATDEINKLRSKKLLEGVIASCAYMAFADGHVDAVEKQKTLELMSNHQYLKLFDQKDVIECFDSYIKCFENDFDEGEIYVFESLNPLKGSTEESSLILAVALDIANADGIFSPEEERTLKRIRLILDA
ncbi:TerB family tellurite resistance protein [Vibrio parahaemolyticus]|uniref:TerB family tellurite resistance protein n=4 Tax=Vibrio TaxID=662 RepID=UPI0009BB8080|nr:TerB family tellurite resistance protein [Vibrio parahaemolyticus]EGR2220526.1 hypothetical protein [Vibrio parahaemolyticus]MCF9166718.1 TerB family tellurite resistance protein [Vibrio parahaemolyticus]MCX8796423.1 TerB family tellurite resistance protein [Vibrio parahaemolyticus]HDY7669567.1 TerB family tellurite resistance protein [Vibrio vulnificus]